MTIKLTLVEKEDLKSIFDAGGRQLEKFVQAGGNLETLEKIAEDKGFDSIMEKYLEGEDIP